MYKRYGIMIICAVILVFCFVGTTSARTWSVDDDGGADFIRIQDAINNAKDGDTIFVYSGVYYENVVVDISITLKGIDHPVVDANGSGSVIALNADGITLEGLNATNSGSTWVDVGIRVVSNNNSIKGNNFSNNYYGIDLHTSSNNSITGNDICDNNRHGIYLYKSSNNTIKGNNFSNNHYGIDLRSSSNNSITGNDICDNNCHGIYLSKSSSNNTITGNNASKNKDKGIYLSYTSNNTITKNNVGSNDGYGIELYSSRNSTITGNNVCNNENGISIAYSSNNNIIGNNASNNNAAGISLSGSYNNIKGNNVCNNSGDGIFLVCGSNNNIKGNNVCNNDDGIYIIDLSSNSTITGNNASNNKDNGIHLSGSCNNIKGNNFSNNGIGIELYNTCNNTITGNNVWNNNNGIYLRLSSSNNKIYLNNFINNTHVYFVAYPAYDDSTNVWNSPLEITYTYDGTTYESYLGNYWDDYEENYPNAEEIDSTGIWDTPYSIYKGNGDKDIYPLIKPWIGDGTTEAKVKFRGVIVNENHPTTCYNCKIRIDEILIDPSDVLNSGDVIWVWAFSGGPATVDDVSIGDKVEVYGKYDGELHKEVKLETVGHYLKKVEYNPVIEVPDIAPSGETGYVGTTFQFVFDIRNKGSVEDTLELSARALEHPEFWHIELSKKSVILFPQESERVFLSVTAKDLVYDDIIVEAVSRNDKTKTGKRKFNVNTVYETPLLLNLRGLRTIDYEASAPDHVKINDAGTIISVVFDLDKTTSTAREATIVIKDKNTEDSVSLSFKLAEFPLITTNFHVWRDGYNFPNWGGDDGHCQGMVVSSLFFYLKKYPLPSGYENTYKISKEDPESISIINDFQENIRRLLIDENHAFSAFDLDESKEYENLKRGLNRGEPVELSIWEKWPIIKLPLWKDTHSVLAYKIIEKGDVATIYIYDPDFPFKPQDYNNPFGDSYRYCTYNMKSREFHYERGDESYNAFISATIEEFQQTPTPKGTVDEYCSKSQDGYQYCLNLNSDGTCTLKLKRLQDIETAVDGTWDKDGKYIIREIESEMYFFTEIEGDNDVFWKLDNGNLLGERRIFFSPKATPLKSAVGMYTKETEHNVVEIELKSDGSFEERVIYSPGDFTEKWGGIWNEGEDQILTIVCIKEDGRRSTGEYLRLDNTKIVPYYAFSNWPNPWSQIYTKQ